MKKQEKEKVEALNNAGSKELR